MSDLDDRSALLQDWLGGVPTVRVLADCTCETLCGPTISIVSNALAIPVDADGNFQMCWKFCLKRDCFRNLINALSLAGAGEIEPPNGGIKSCGVRYTNQRAF
jgi:hypothetical protein